MREFLLACVLTASAFLQTGAVGLFSGSTDVGAPPLKGAAEFNPATREYTITGTGTDIWDRANQFHYLWREMSATSPSRPRRRFLTDGIAHRKASIMLRKTVDTDSPFVHLAIHGDGMPSVQFRSAKGDTVNTLDFPIGGPGVWTLRARAAGRGHPRLGGERRRAADRTRNYAESVGESRPRWPRRQFAYADGDQHRGVLERVGGTACGPGRRAVAARPDGQVTCLICVHASSRRVCCCRPRSSRRAMPSESSPDPATSAIPPSWDRRRSIPPWRIPDDGGRRQHVDQAGSISVRVAGDDRRLHRHGHVPISRRRQRAPQGRHHGAAVPRHRLGLRGRRRSRHRHAVAAVAAP